MSKLLVLSSNIYLSIYLCMIKYDPRALIEYLFKFIYRVVQQSDNKKSFGSNKISKEKYNIKSVGAVESL